MEERIIDDEKGRKVRLKKTEDGYVDVTDDEAADGDEVEFEYPLFETDEDDEELAGLTPEEALALRKKREEEAAARLAEYEKLCQDGEKLLQDGDFAAAESVFEKALLLDGIATAASVGYWRAKTENFANPDVLIEEYVDAGIENLEYDLGYEAVEQIKKDYGDVFKRRHDELSAEEEPLAKTVEENKLRRREILRPRLKKAWVWFVVAALPTLAFLITTVLYVFKNFTTPDNKYLPITIGFGAAFAVAFVVFAVVSNRLINTRRIYKANEKTSATDEGVRLLEVQERKELYGALCS